MIEKLPAELYYNADLNVTQIMLVKLNELIDVVNALDKMVLHPDIPQDYKTDSPETCLMAYCLCSGQDFQGNCIQCGKKKLKANQTCDHKWEFIKELWKCRLCGLDGEEK